MNRPCAQPVGDRTGFYDRFPALFGGDAAARAFFAGEDDASARGLFADIPTTFPTVTAHVRAIPDDVGPEIDVLLINESANDADFEAILDSLDGPSPREIDRLIREFGYEKLNALLEEARRKCPNALMIVPSYFSPFALGWSRGSAPALLAGVVAAAPAAPPARPPRVPAPRHHRHGLDLHASP